MSRSSEQRRVDLHVLQGKTFTRELRWGQEPFKYAQVTQVDNTAPLQLVAPGHGVPDGWPVAISGIGRLRDYCALYDPPAASDYRRATVVDANTLAFNEVNGLLLPTKPAYVSGGAVQYLTPVDLTGLDARMDVRNDLGEVVLSIRPVDGYFTINTVQHVVTLRLPPAVTRDITWRKGRYEIELFNANDVFLLAHGSMTVTEEVFTDG